MKSNNNFSRFLRGEVQREWSLLDTDSLEQANGDRANLVNLLTVSYGFSQRRAQIEIDRVISELSEKLKLAA